MSLQDMTDRIKRGELQIHKFAHGFFVTEIKDYPEERVLVVQLLSGARGHKREWVAEGVEHLRRFAKENNCAAVEATCRLGLEPLLKPFGWKRTRVLLRMEP